MATYKVVAVIWQDHLRVNRDELTHRVEEDLVTTITTGVLVKKTKSILVIASDIERYRDRDDLSYMVIIRKTVEAIKEFGEIEIENLRIAP